MNVTVTADTDGVSRFSKGIASAINGINSIAPTGALVVCRIGVNSTTMFGILVKATNTVWFGMITETSNVKVSKFRWTSATPEDCTLWVDNE